MGVQGSVSHAVHTLHYFAVLDDVQRLMDLKIIEGVLTAAIHVFGNLQIQ